jgi:hypothetical protein
MCRISAGNRRRALMAARGAAVGTVGQNRRIEAISFRVY